MAIFEGTVSGIDAQATPGINPRCQAIISNVDSAQEIQVETERHILQTALEMACGARSKVEVTYDEAGPQRTLTRVRILDR